MDLIHPENWKQQLTACEKPAICIRGILGGNQLDEVIDIAYDRGWRAVAMTDTSYGYSFLFEQIGD